MVRAVVHRIGNQRLIVRLRPSNPFLFVRTPGVITDTGPGVPAGESSADSIRVAYRYSVAGVEYAGTGIGRMWGVPGVPSRQIGGAIPVYYDNSSPSRSFPFSAPQPWAWLGGMIVFTGLGLVAIIAGWPH